MFANVLAFLCLLGLRCSFALIYIPCAGDEFTVGCVWFYELFFPVFPLENVRVAVRKMINEAKSKWRLKKAFNRSRIWSFREEKNNKQETQTKPKHSPEAQPIKTRVSALTIALLPTHTKSWKGFCGWLCVTLRNRCVWEKEGFSFWGERDNRGKCFIYSKYVACVSVGQSLVARVWEAGEGRILKCLCCGAPIRAACVKTF